MRTCARRGGGHVVLEADDLRGDVALCGGAASLLDALAVVTADDREANTGHAREGADDLHHRSDTETSARHEHAQGLYRGRGAQRSDAAERWADGDTGGGDRRGRGAVAHEIARSTPGGCAERVDAGLGPERVRRVIGDDADERRAELADEARPTEHGEREEVGGDDRVGCCADGKLTKAPTGGPVERRAQAVGDRPALVERGVSVTVEPGRVLGAPEVRRHIGAREPPRGQRQRIDELGRDATLGSGFDDRAGRCLVPAPRGTMKNEQSGAMLRCRLRRS